MEEKVILVDEKDRPIGEEEKMRAHRVGRLHRSFSIFVLNSKGEMLLQQRAKSKYHSGGLWSNACCGHPRPGEGTEQAAHRRLREEMGFDCELRELLQFTYKVKLDYDLWEYEFDHVFVGMCDGDVHPNTEEADAYDWVDTETLQEEVKRYPKRYTEWFKIAFPRVLN